MNKRARFLPCDNNEQVQAVPGITKVGSLSEHPHGEYLNAHFDGEEGEDEVVESFQDLAPGCRTGFVYAWLVHAKRQTVE